MKFKTEKQENINKTERHFILKISKIAKPLCEIEKDKYRKDISYQFQEWNRGYYYNY